MASNKKKDYTSYLVLKDGSRIGVSIKNIYSEKGVLEAHYACPECAKNFRDNTANAFGSMKQFYSCTDHTSVKVEVKDILDRVMKDGEKFLLFAKAQLAEFIAEGDNGDLTFIGNVDMRNFFGWFSYLILKGQQLIHYENDGLLATLYDSLVSESKVQIYKNSLGEAFAVCPQFEFLCIFTLGNLKRVLPSRMGGMEVPEDIKSLQAKLAPMLVDKKDELLIEFRDKLRKGELKETITTQVQQGKQALNKEALVGTDL